MTEIRTHVCARPAVPSVRAPRLVLHHGIWPGWQVAVMRGAASLWRGALPPGGLAAQAVDELVAPLAHLQVELYESQPGAGALLLSELLPDPGPEQRAMAEALRQDSAQALRELETRLGHAGLERDLFSRWLEEVMPGEALPDWDALRAQFAAQEGALRRRWNATALAPDPNPEELTAALTHCRSQGPLMTVAAELTSAPSAQHSALQALIADWLRAIEAQGLSAQRVRGALQGAAVPHSALLVATLGDWCAPVAWRAQHEHAGSLWEWRAAHDHDRAVHLNWERQRGQARATEEAQLVQAIHNQVQQRAFQDCCEQAAQLAQTPEDAQRVRAVSAALSAELARGRLRLHATDAGGAALSLGECALPLQGNLSPGLTQVRAAALGTLGPAGRARLLAAAQLAQEYSAPGSLETNLKFTEQLALTLNPLLQELTPNHWTLEMASPELQHWSAVRRALIPDHPPRPWLAGALRHNPHYPDRYRALRGALGPEQACEVAYWTTGKGQLPASLGTERRPGEMLWADLLVAAGKIWNERPGAAYGWGTQERNLRMLAGLARDTVALHRDVRASARRGELPRAMLRLSSVGEGVGILRGLKRHQGDLALLHDELVQLALEIPDEAAPGAKLARRKVGRAEKAAQLKSERLAEQRQAALAKTMPLIEEPQVLSPESAATLKAREFGDPQALMARVVQAHELTRVGKTLRNCARTYTWAVRHPDYLLVLAGPDELVSDLRADRRLHLGLIRRQAQGWKVEQCSTVHNDTSEASRIIGELLAARGDALAALQC